MTQLSVKVFLVENKSTKEIRKFAVDGEVAESYEYLVGKIKQVFPSLLRKDLELFWKDEENDYITISSDTELAQAVKGIPEDITSLKIYVKVKQQEASQENQEDKEHSGVTCDVCDTTIKGIRYKCTVCFDFDLCSSCERKGIHPAEHELLCIKNPRTTSSVFVIRSPLGRGRGGCRRPDPKGRFGCFRGGFGGPRGGFGGPRCGFFGPRGGFGHPRCHPWSSEEKKETSTEQEKTEEQSNEHDFHEMVKQFALGLGLDPDVATSHANSFIGSEPFENVIHHLAHCFGMDPEILKQNAQEMFGFSNKEATKDEGDVEENSERKKSAPEKCENKMETEESTSQKKADQPKSAENTNVPVEDMVNEFARQLGYAPVDEKNDSNPYAGLGELMGKIFESFAHPVEENPVHEKKDQAEADVQEPASKKQDQKKEDFVVVESKPAELTDEEKYEQRVNDALTQMEAMGFDNDGNWLRQLLIAKDLSIEKVLEALNPSK